MSLEEIQSLYQSSDRSDEDIVDKLQEELEDMLEGMTRGEVRTELEDLEDEEFRDIALDVLDYL